MKFLTAKTRITFGLTCMLVTVLCAAIMIGLVPDPKSAVLAGRAEMCETLAVSSSDYVSRGELRRLEFVLESVVRRNNGCGLVSTYWYLRKGLPPSKL